MLKQRALFAIAVIFFCFIIWVIYLANTNQQSVLFDLVATIPYGDKLGHFGLFGLLSLFVNLALKFKTSKIANFNIYWGSGLVFLFASFEELSQYYIPNRTFDGIDFLADVAGILVFAGISKWLAKIIYPNSNKE